MEEDVKCKEHEVVHTMELFMWRIQIDRTWRLGVDRTTETYFCGVPFMTQMVKQ